LIEAKPKAKYTIYNKFNEYHYSKKDWIIDTNRSSIDYVTKSNSYFRFGFNIEEKNNGLYIKNLSKKSPSKEAGLKKKDQIIEIDGIKINSEKDFYENYLIKNLNPSSNSKKTVIIKIKRKNKILTKKVVPELKDKKMNTDSFNLKFYDGDDATGKHKTYIDNDVKIDIKNNIVIHTVDFGNDLRGKIKFRYQCSRGDDSSGKNSTTPSSTVSGSGFFINNQGYFITNAHVVEKCEDNSKIYYNNKNINAKLIAKDKYLDLALLKADIKNNNYLSISNKPATKLQRIIAAGYPFGKYLSDDLKFTSGIVSSLKGLGDDSTRMQIDAALNPGNSGGPIINERNGQVVGVAVSGLRKDKTEAVNYAIKGMMLKSFILSNQIEIETQKEIFERDKIAEVLEKSTIYTFCN
jgi:S1-C subfamily serine protease